MMKKKWKNGICLVLLFALMFAAGIGIAERRAGQTIGVFSVSGEAGNWGLGFGAEGSQPTGSATAEELKQYDAYYVGDKAEKVIYLTFDCGYEKGR